MNWSKLTDDPLNKNIKLLIQKHLNSISHLYSKDLLSFFCEKSLDRKVLHIGCYEHNNNYMNSDSWKHKQIHKVSRKCIGVDINKKGIQFMNKLGFAAIYADATSNKFLGSKFNVLIAGDVIEHVQNIKGFMKFLRRHLSTNGRIYISSPNPFFFSHVLSAWTSRPMVANFEHTTWISESTMLEICRRSKFTLEKIIYPIGKSNKSIFLRLIKTLTFKLGGTFFFTTIIYELKK